MQADAVTVFILPPSMQELKARLERRAEDKPDVIARRLANAREEIARWSMYDYVVINDTLESAYARVRAILAAERVRRERITGLPAFVDGLLGDA
jgi:guanylate kinase